MSTPIPENAASFTARELSAATGGELTRLPDDRTRVVGLVTDSRKLAPGNGFLAVRGDRFDGHAFLASAISRGASLVVVQRGRVVPSGPVAVLEVSDVIEAFGQIAHAHVLRWRRGGDGRARVAALTGSAGKTTTKGLVHAILATAGACHGTTG